MRRPHLLTRAMTVAALGALAVAATAPGAGAIVYGSPDGTAHPNVGSLVLPTGGDPFQVCTGTLIAPKVFLTAAHCLFGNEAFTLAVTFDPTISAASHLYSGHGVFDPRYTDYKGQGGASDPHDVAVFLLDQAPSGVTPAPVAGVGYLDARKATLKSARFVSVGYGTIRTTRKGAASGILDNAERRVATSGFLSLENAWLNQSMNQALGNGGTCFGDSGGPHFLDGVVVAITSIGDSQCKALDKSYRVDTAPAQDFLAPFLHG